MPVSNSECSTPVARVETVKPANDGVLLDTAIYQGRDVDDAEKPALGLVIEVGRGVPWLKPGTAVVYRPQGAIAFFIDRALVHQRDVLAIVEHPLPCSAGPRGQR